MVDWALQTNFLPTYLPTLLTVHGAPSLPVLRAHKGTMTSAVAVTGLLTKGTNLV